MPSNDSHSDAHDVAPRPLTRAGVRRLPRGGDEPTGAFVVIEMAVLFCVSALAMVSIIVSIDDGSAAHASRLDDRSATVMVGSAAAAVARHDADGKAATSTNAQVAR